MAIQRKRFVRIWSMFLLNLFRKIYKNASLDFKNMEKEGKNGARLVLRLAFTLDN
jgi:hypothetical protein